MKNRYQMILDEYLDRAEYFVPITTGDLCEHLALITGEMPEALRLPANVVMSRLEKTRPDLFRYRKGIYYRSKETVFGFGKLDPLDVIRKKYVIDGEEIIGYEAGPSLLNKAGLSTQMAAHLYLATNKHRGRGLITDEKLKVRLSKPLMKVTRDNYQYLQVLELILLTAKPRAYIQTNDPYGMIFRLIKRLGLDYAKLMYHAEECGGGRLAELLVKVFHRGVKNEIA